MKTGQPRAGTASQPPAPETALHPSNALDRAGAWWNPDNWRHHRDTTMPAPKRGAVVVDYDPFTLGGIYRD